MRIQNQNKKDTLEKVYIVQLNLYVYIYIYIYILYIHKNSDLLLGY